MIIATFLVGLVLPANLLFLPIAVAFPPAVTWVNKGLDGLAVRFGEHIHFFGSWLDVSVKRVS